MAKKKKNNAPAPAKPVAPAVEDKGEKVIDQLFGRLDQEPDIESDIAEMGNSDVEAESPEKPRKSRFFFGFAVFVIIMAVIGCISTVRFVAGVTGSLLDNTSLKTSSRSSSSR